MSNTRKLIQAFLIILFVFAALRLYLIYHGRHEGEQPKQQQAAPGLDPDYYVTPKKLYAYDLKSAQQLTRQPVWVKEGYRSTYYPFVNGHADFRHEAGTLGPLEKLQITEVVKDRPPSPHDAPQLVAVFEKNGTKYAVPVGQIQGSDFRIYADEIFFLEDPHQLYKHWPADIWQAIDAHQVKKGMNEMQATFALGMGVPQKSDDPEVKTVTFPNGGDQVVITFRNGKAADIQSQQRS